jgi:hypothetical protein
MITKALFASGLQCAKRLYLDYQHPDEIPEPSARRQGLAEIGAKLVELARAAFPESQSADSKNAKTAIEQTAKMLGERKPIAVFDGAFATDDIEVRTDIVIPDGSGRVDVYEVKSGAKIKKRHIRDLALQVHAIEHSGFEVRVAWILHLNSHSRTST